MKFSVHTTERMEDQIADQGIIPDKLTGEESGEEESGEEESGEQTEDSGSASEWRPDIEILFRQPIYSSDTGPRFPQELIERICEFLWDEPVQLAVSCTRICPAWYHAARRLLPEHDITWQTREALQDHAHTLTSLRNAPYRKRFQQLLIYDNASKPFAHVWPMFIPGWILPKVRVVTLGDLDWSTRTPHDSFFVYLSSYTRILTLSLRTCRFRKLMDLRRVINALLNLTSLHLNNVTIQHPLRPGSVPDYIALRARSHKLQSIELCGPKQEHPDVSSDCLGTTALNCQALLHMVAGNSSTVTRLALDLRFFTSPSALQRYLAHFCRLTAFEAQYQFASSPLITFAGETTPTCTENTYIHSWESFTLMDVPDQSALQLLQLLVTPIWYSKLHNFHIHLAGRPSAALLSCTSRVLHALGNRLWSLTWMCSVNPDLEVIPSLAGNTTLKTLWIHLRDIAPLPQEIHSALTAVLSDIVSVDLQHVSIWFTLAHLEPEVLPQNHGRTPVAPDPAEAISAFHTILSREIFNGLPRHFSNFKCVEVDFYVGNIQDNPAVVATIKAYIINLFTPWLDRGIVKLVFISADSSEHITCVPASMLSEDTSSDSKVEDVQENEPVGTEQ